MAKPDKGNLQILMLDTIMGPQPRYAPARWEFDKTAVIAWCALLHQVEELARPQRRRTRLMHHRIDGKIEVLCNVLANALGMASTYWLNQAEEINKIGLPK